MADSFARLFLEAMRYEHWLRFYFLEDAPEVPMQASAEQELAVEAMDAVLIMPEEAVARSKKEEPHLAAMLPLLLEKSVSMEHSRDVIFAYLGQTLGIVPNSAEFEAKMTELSGSEEFRRSMDWFHGWVQELANNEIDLKGNALPPGAPRDEYIPSFREWDNAFQFWFSLQKPFAIENFKE